jgi:hypothetical protein
MGAALTYARRYALSHWSACHPAALPMPGQVPQLADGLRDQRRY